MKPSTSGYVLSISNCPKEMLVVMYVSLYCIAARSDRSSQAKHKPRLFNCKSPNTFLGTELKIFIGSSLLLGSLRIAITLVLSQANKVQLIQMKLRIVRKYFSSPCADTVLAF